MNDEGKEFFVSLFYLSFIFEQASKQKIYCEPTHNKSREKKYSHRKKEFEQFFPLDKNNIIKQQQQQSKEKQVNDKKK